MNVTPQRWFKLSQGLRSKIIERMSLQDVLYRSVGNVANDLKKREERKVAREFLEEMAELSRTEQ